MHIKKILKIIPLCGLLALGACGGGGGEDDDEPSIPTVTSNYETLFSPDHVIGSMPAPDTVTASASLSTTSGEDIIARGSVTVSGATATAVTINLGYAGENGPVAVTLSDSGGGTWTVPAGVDLDQDELNRLGATGYYVWIETPAGNLRGQIAPPETIVASFDLNANSVVPASNSTGSGKAGFAFNVQTGFMRARITLEGVSDATSAGLRSAIAGARGDVEIALEASATDPNVWGSIDINNPNAGTRLGLAGIDLLLNGEMYFSVESTSNPDGALRAQIIDPDSIKIFDTPLTSTEVVTGGAPVNSNAQGVATVTWIDALSKFAVAVNTDAENVSSVSVHQGAPGVNGTLLFSLTPDVTLAGNWHMPLSDLDSDLRSALEGDEFYVSIVTATHAGGELRGQIYLQNQVFESGRIEFVTDRTGLFTQPGQSHEFVVQVLDANGTPIPGSSVDWNLDDDSGLQLEATGPLSARVTVQDWSLGSRMLRVSSASAGRAAQGQVLMAVLEDNAFLFDDGLLVSADRDPVSSVATVVLDRTTETESLQVGDILLIGRLTPIQDEILSVGVGADSVTLTTEPAGLRQVFAELDYHWTVEGETYTGYRPSAQPQSGASGFAKTSNDPACEVGGEIVPIASLSDNLPVPRITPTLTIRIRLTALGDTEDFAFIVARFAGSIEQPPWELELGGSLVGTLECNFDLPRLVSPPVSVFKIPMRLGFQPRTGFAGNVTLSQTLTVTGPGGTVTGYSDFGVIYANNTWAPIEVSQWDAVQTSDFKLNEIPGATLEVGIAPFLSMDTQLIAGGSPLPSAGLPSISIAEVDFLEIKAALPAELSIQLPLSPLDRDYTGPRWTVAATLEASLKAALSGGAAETFFKLLGIPTSVPGELELLPEVTLEQFTSPVISLQPDCTSPCVVEPGTEMFVQAVTDHIDEGEISIVAADGDDTDVQFLGQLPLLLGQAGFNIPPAPDGRDRSLLARLRTNELTQTLPYAELASPVVISVPGALTPVSHEIFAYANTQGGPQSQAYDQCPGGSDEERREPPPVEFDGSVDTAAAASHSAGGTSGQSASDVISGFEEGDNVVMTMNTSASSSVSASFVPDGFGGDLCRYGSYSSASTHAIRKFIVSAPMTYQIEASCEASSTPSELLASGASGRATIHIVDGEQSGLLYSYTCDETGTDGSPSGNGILFPGAEVQLRSDAVSEATVGEPGEDSSATTVSVTLTLSPQ